MAINLSDSAILYLQLEMKSPQTKCLSVINVDWRGIAEDCRASVAYHARMGR